MKKLLFIIILPLFWNNIAFSQTQTYECRNLPGYIEDDWKYVINFSDETATLIIENKVHADEWGALRNGYATFIYNNEKIEFVRSGYSGEAYNYRKIDAEDVKSSKTLKKYKGKLSYISFLKLRRQAINKNYFDLDYSVADGLWTMETKINQMGFRVHRFVCRVDKN